MTRMLITAGALALAVATTSTAVMAAPAYGQSVQPSAVAAQPRSNPAAPWHYEWQYHFAKGGDYVAGWVAVLNSAS